MPRSTTCTVARMSSDVDSTSSDSQTSHDQGKLHVPAGHSDEVGSPIEERNTNTSVRNDQKMLP